MPYAIMLTAYSDNNQSLYKINGAQLQAAFLNLIRQIDPELSQSLHDGDALRPYSLSLFQPKIGVDCDRPIKKVLIRIACLDDKIYPVLLKIALSGKQNNYLHFSGVNFQISHLATTDERQPSWVGFTSYQDLLSKAETLQKQHFISLDFGSATTFRQREKDVPIPMPDSVFSGLARRWNSTTNVPELVPEEVIAKFSESVTVSQFQGETITVDIGDKLKKTGFIGRFTYRIINPEISFWCHLLSEMVFFSGLGAKTSRGLGCARKL